MKTGRFFWAFAIGLAFVMIGSGTALAQRQLISHKGMRVVTTPGFQCAEKMTGKVIGDNEDVFSGDRLELQRMLGGLRAALSFDCNKFQEIKIVGEVDGKPVFHGEIAASDGWVLKTVDTPVVASQPPSSNQLMNPPRTFPRVEEPRRLRALSSLSSGYEQCRELLYWFERVNREFGDRYARLAPGNKVHAMLFSDRDFVALFGKPYDQMSARKLKSFNRSVRTSCLKYSDIARQWSLRTTWALQPFYAKFARDFVVKHLEVHRIERRWMDQKIAEISTLPPNETNWNTLIQLKSEAKQRLANLWPSERKLFISAIEVRREAIAPAIAARQIVKLPPKYESLGKIAEIQRTLRVRVQSADQRAKVTKLVDSRREEIEGKIIQKEIAALKDVSDDLKGLNELPQREQDVSKKVGGLPAAYAEAVKNRAKEIRSKLVEKEIAALSSVPSDASGLGQLIERKRRVKKELGNIPQNYRNAINDKARQIISSKYASIEKELTNTDLTFFGAALAKAASSVFLDSLLNEAAPDYAKKLANAIQKRIDFVHDSIFKKAQRDISALNVKWRDVPRIWELGKEKADLFQKRGLEKSANQLLALANSRSLEIVKASKPSFLEELKRIPATWKGFESLAEFEQQFAVRLVRIRKPLFGEFRGAIHQRRADLLDGIAKDAIAHISKVKGGWTGVEAMVRLGDTLAVPFDRQNAPKVAESIRNAARQQAIATVKSELPNFEKEIARLEGSRENAAMLLDQADTFESRSQSYPRFASYSTAARKRANVILGKVCDEALSRAKITNKDGKLPLFGDGKAIPLRDFVCDLDSVGHEVASFDAPGLLSLKKEYQLKILLTDGSYQHVKLHMTEALPGQEMLVGFAVGDANNQKQISVNEWKQYVIALDNGGILFIKGRRILKTDRQNALEMIETSASRGYHPAQYVMGMAYKEGLGRERNFDKAIKLLGQAAKGGSTKANLQLGAIYYLGRGTQKDTIKALEYYKKAASAGSKKARKVVQQLEIVVRNDEKIREIGLKEELKEELRDLKQQRELLRDKKREIERKIEKSREPTEEEMRAAITARLNVANETTSDLNRRCRNREFRRGGGDPILAMMCLGLLGGQAATGAKETITTLSQFEKISCAKAIGLSGFICDFVAGQNINILPGYLAELSARGKFSQGRFIRRGKEWVYQPIN